VELVQASLGVTAQYVDPCLQLGIQADVGRRDRNQLVELVHPEQGFAGWYHPARFGHAVGPGLVQLIESVLGIAEHQRRLAEQQPRIAVLVVSLQDLLGLDIGRAILAAILISKTRRDTALATAQATTSKHQAYRNQHQDTPWRPSNQDFHGSSRSRRLSTRAVSARVGHFLQIILFQKVVQRGPTDAQQVGHPREVAALPREGAPDRALLSLRA